ncbi:MAG: serine/threonine protein kinase [Planctomycetes bacterium]|nr:serine/threonine protein kinase [Planctomycetota bacterium]MBL7041870.1 serine/threonine protein kinase [Pirellulaceae bacterium]
MLALKTAHDFLMLLEKSRLLSAGDLKSAVERFGLDDMLTPEDVADSLVAKDLLTLYQANRLLEGRRRGLFIDDFKILELLGSGGMGYLYIAEDLDAGWDVALKVLSDRFRNDKGMLTRFQLEADAGLKLSHPHIVKTKAIRRTEDIYGTIHYMVMELVRGASLHELLSIRKRTLNWRRAADVICQTATALHYAHELGLVHRDVKPENLLIRRDGFVKLLDFGLAMIGGNETEFSLSSILGQSCLGTADYIAPEQSLDSLNVDRRADIYALGCTFYFLVTGRVPFPDKSVSKKLNGHRQKKPPPVRKLNPHVPDKIAKIIQKMMAKQPKNRFQTAEEVLRFLEPLAERKSVKFDFAKLLKKRAKLAEQRLATESKLRGDSRASTVSKLEIGRSSRLRRSGVETVVEKDTVIDRRKP